MKLNVYPIPALATATQIPIAGCSKGSDTTAAAPAGTQATPAISKDAGMIKSDIQKEQDLDKKKQR